MQTYLIDDDAVDDMLGHMLQKGGRRLSRVQKYKGLEKYWPYLTAWIAKEDAASDVRQTRTEGPQELYWPADSPKPRSTRGP